MSFVLAGNSDDGSSLPVSTPHSSRLTSLPLAWSCQSLNCPAHWPGLSLWAPA